MAEPGERAGLQVAGGGNPVEVRILSAALPHCYPRHAVPRRYHLRGLGRRPLTAEKGVRIPVAVPQKPCRSGAFFRREGMGRSLIACWTPCGPSWSSFRSCRRLRVGATQERSRRCPGRFASSPVMAQSALIQALKDADDAVEEAEVPDPLREAAFVRALDYLLGGGSAAASGSPLPSTAPEAATRDQAAGGAGARTTGRSNREAARHRRWDRFAHLRSGRSGRAHGRSAHQTRPRRRPRHKIARLVPAARQAARLSRMDPRGGGPARR